MAGTALLLVLSITVYITTITKSRASFVVAWAQQGNLSSPTPMKSITRGIPTAESIYKLESMILPSSVRSFIILIANKAHKSWQMKNTS
jgi:hypothetical protein